MMKFFNLLFSAILILTVSFLSPACAEDQKSLSGEVADRFAEAQEKLLNAKGSYKTIKMQEDAIKNMRRATKLSLRASKMRAKAEKLQNKADSLVNKANLAALSRGLYITNPLAPVMMLPPPQLSAEGASSPPVPGQSIKVNVSIPKSEEVSLQGQKNNYAPEPSTENNY